jgi:NAD(P)H dehydrogenase (quinone)
METQAMIMITGGSGQLSTLVAQKAATAGLPFVTGSSTVSDGAPDRRRIDFDDPATLDFSGVSTLFLVSAGYAEDDVVMARHENAIAAADAQGVKHLIYTSLSATGDHLAFALAHRWTERRLRQSGLSWTVLRNGLYAELIGTLAAPVDGAIRAPFGSALISPVAREDLAEAAIAVLAAPEQHADTVYELAGKDSWSVADLAERMGIPYAPAALETTRQSLSSMPLLPFQPPMLMSIYAAAAAGFLESRSTDLGKLLQTAPRDTLALAAAAIRSGT